MTPTEALVVVRVLVVVVVLLVVAAVRCLFLGQTRTTNVPWSLAAVGHMYVHALMQIVSYTHASR